MNYKLKEIRNENNISMQEMSDKLGISKPFYSQLENGKRRLTYEMAVKIASIFNEKPDKLFYEDFNK